MSKLLFCLSAATLMTAASVCTAQDDDSGVAPQKTDPDAARVSTAQSGKETVMKRKRYTPEQIIRKLRIRIWP